MWLCLALVVVSLVGGVINLGANYLFIHVGLNALLRLRTDLYACLQSLPLKYHDAKRSSDSSFRVAYDSQSIQTIYNKGFATILSSIVMLVWTFGIMVWMNWPLALDVAGRPPVCRLGDWFFRGSRAAAVHHNSRARERPPGPDSGGYQSNTDGARLWPRNLRDPPISQAGGAKPRSRSAIQHHLDRQLAGRGNADGGRHRADVLRWRASRCSRAR